MGMKFQEMIWEIQFISCCSSAVYFSVLRQLGPVRERVWGCGLGYCSRGRGDGLLPRDP